MSETVFNAQDWVYVPDAMGRLGQGYYENRRNASQTITIAEFERRRSQPVQVTSKKEEQNINNSMPVSATAQTSRLQTTGTTDSQLTPWSNPISGEQTISDTGGSQTAKASAQTDGKAQKKKEIPKENHEGGDGGNTGEGVGSASDTDGSEANGDGGEGGAKVICTEMGTQGLMSSFDQKACLVYAHKYLPPSFMEGYHFWAVPYVRLMRRSKFATALIVPFVHHRTKEVKFRLGLSKKGSWCGKLICAFHDPLCCLLGKIVKPADYRSLYPLKT
ncbi:MAG: hypothetical protein ACNI26_00915 [Terasakiella sp.]|uniref:hypothetical protein n=1 Tax=unclassified Terasakiella TaxID=2614952 RepID=UPI003B00F367